MQQNPQEPTPDQNHCLSRLVKTLNHPIVKTAIATSIVALSVGSGFVDCLNKNGTEINACLGKRAPLAIGFGFVGAVFSAVIFKCIRECNQNPNSRVVPLGPPDRVVPDRGMGHR